MMDLDTFKPQYVFKRLFRYFRPFGSVTARTKKFANHYLQFLFSTYNRLLFYSYETVEH